MYGTLSVSVFIKYDTVISLYLFVFCCTNESIPTLSLKPAVNVAVTQSVSYQSTMMWGQVGNFYNVFLMIHKLTVINQQIILSTYRRLHLKEMHI